MPSWKVAYFTGVGARADVMLDNAPDNVEVTVVDRTLPAAEQIQLCRDADAIISSEVTTEVLRECPNVKLIQTLSAGYDRMDLETILEMGIPVANNGGANAISVSEQTLALMIGISRNLMAQWDTTTRQRQWRGDLYQTDLSEVTDKTVGIIGMGRIGRQVAKRLTGFDTRTIYYDIEDIPEDVQQAVKAEPVGFDELLATSDIVSLHVPLTRRTRGMMSDREFDLMKSTAFFINLCRGPVVDEAALYRALTEGKIAGAGLDVLEVEPTPAENPLFDLDNVIITPHMAGQSQETALRAAHFAYANILRVLNGQAAESLVTPE
ncbi:MAG: lactate dehydrogenase [Chloroflexi bacterium]|nr:lactate dehydrogenase [Chloroflexota bacterium]MYD47016.1 lactate dehydrogenase [Chloroflexota bacterium]